MYVKTSVVKPLGISPGSSAAKNPMTTIVDVADILFFPPRDSKGIRHVGNLVMKPNAKMVQIYMTKSKISAPYESDGDEDSINIKQSFEGQHPGNKIEIREFIQNWLGKDVIVIHGNCSEPEMEIVGTPCAPLQLKPSKQDNNDGRFHMLKFEAFATSQYLPGLYTGALSLGAPVVLEDHVSISLASAEGNIFQLPEVTTGIDDGTISIGLNEFETGAVVSLIGGGGSNPAILENVETTTLRIILKNGTAWTALKDAVINFEVLDAGANTYFIEKSRS